MVMFNIHMSKLTRKEGHEKPSNRLTVLCVDLVF